jgi:hypothetical protein
MADKPLVQQDTAKNIGDVITLIKPDNAYLFIEAFWSVLNSKWHEIDRVRTDKFYLLMREIIHASFQLLDDREWDIKNVKKMMDIYTRYCLDTSKTYIPAGIPSHVISCFHDELSKIVEDTDEINIHYDILMNTLFGALPPNEKNRNIAIHDSFEINVFPKVIEFMDKHKSSNGPIHKQFIKVKSLIHQILLESKLSKQRHDFVQSQLDELNELIVGGDINNITKNPPVVHYKDAPIAYKQTKEPQPKKETTKKPSTEVKSVEDSTPASSSPQKRQLINEDHAKPGKIQKLHYTAASINEDELALLRDEQLFEISPEVFYDEDDSDDSNDKPESNILLVPSTSFIVTDQTEEDANLSNFIDQDQESSDFVINSHLTNEQLTQIDTLLRANAGDNPSTLNLDLPAPLSSFSTSELLDLDAKVTSGLDVDAEADLELGEPESRYLDPQSIYVLSQLCYPAFPDVQEDEDDDEEDEDYEDEEEVEDEDDEESESEDSDVNINEGENIIISKSDSVSVEGAQEPFRFKLPADFVPVEGEPMEICSPSEERTPSPGPGIQLPAENGSYSAGKLNSVRFCLGKNTIRTFPFNSLPDLEKIKVRKELSPTKSAIKSHTPYEYVSECMRTNNDRDIKQATLINTNKNIIAERGIEMATQKRLRAIAQRRGNKNNRNNRNRR